MMFEIGKEYRNRKGSYVVLSIRGGALRVRYEDGSEATLNAVDQERIISNMRRGNRSNSSWGSCPHKSNREEKPCYASSQEGPQKESRCCDVARSWNRYELWNTAIFEFFFNQSYVQPVRIHRCG